MEGIKLDNFTIQELIYELVSLRNENRNLRNESDMLRGNLQNAYDTIELLKEMLKESDK